MQITDPVKPGGYILISVSMISYKKSLHEETVKAKG